ncbi:cell envelope biogenesis protein OmpA [Streptomyces sp. MP131-18]|uniref:cell envelope biogenesis protein OmpA n=1 Tax=Streptomyces sp. MP131-18 TaxID=1857892 RepID=UPI00097BB195|nr:cell envelope biogenesis protein OmpA [Streptomyces sp. MP131-18]ONK13256.1 hypothetical protein STBA_40190 [Streptomyces sp. MP131-18]
MSGIPVRCAHRPTSGGLVVPAVSLVHNGHAVFGNLDAARVREAFRHRLCQICAQPLTERLYVIVRPADEANGRSVEPALHPECLRYAHAQCPVLNGSATHYRDRSVLATHPAFRPCGDPTCPYPDKVKPGKDEAARRGQLVERYEAWMIALEHYRLVPGKDNPSAPAGIALDVPVLRKRLLRQAALPPEAEALLGQLRALLDLEP